MATALSFHFWSYKSFIILDKLIQILFLFTFKENENFGINHPLKISVSILNGLTKILQLNY